MSDSRSERIDNAVASGCELVGHIMDKGPLNYEQVRLILEAAVRAKVANAEEWEIRASAKRFHEEIEVAKQKTGAPPWP